MNCRFFFLKWAHFLFFHSCVCCAATFGSIEYTAHINFSSAYKSIDAWIIIFNLKVAATSFVFRICIFIYIFICHFCECSCPLWHIQSLISFTDKLRLHWRKNNNKHIRIWMVDDNTFIFLLECVMRIHGQLASCRHISSSLFFSFIFFCIFIRAIDY